MLLFLYDVLTCVLRLAPIVANGWYISPHSGEVTAKEERIYRFYYLNTFLTIPYAGFFANTHYSAVLLICILPPLKNDGRGGLRFSAVLNDFLYKKIGNVSLPRLSGKVSTDRLTEGASVSRHERIEYKYEQKDKILTGILL